VFVECLTTRAERTIVIIISSCVKEPPVNLFHSSCCPSSCIRERDKRIRAKMLVRETQLFYATDMTLITCTIDNRQTHGCQTYTIHTRTWMVEVMMDGFSVYGWCHASLWWWGRSDGRAIHHLRSKKSDVIVHKTRSRHTSFTSGSHLERGGTWVAGERRTVDIINGEWGDNKNKWRNEKRDTRQVDPDEM
jgi:hypothetical protein